MTNWLIKVDDKEIPVQADTWRVENGILQMINRMNFGYLTVAMFNKFSYLRKQI